MWLNQIFIFIGIIVTIAIGKFIHDRLSLSQYYVLPQTLAVLIIGLLLIVFKANHLELFRVAIEPMMGLTTLFVLTLGINIGLNIKWKNALKELVPLMGFILIVYALLIWMSMKPVELFSLVFSPFRIGWSADTIKVLSMSYDANMVISFLNLSFIMAILSTPLFLYLLSKHFHLSKAVKNYEYHYSFSGFILAVCISLFLGYLIYFQIPFIYISTFSFLLGVGLGAVFGKHVSFVGKNSEWLLGILTCATFGNALIIVIENTNNISSRLVVWMLVYFLSITFIHFMIAQMMKKEERHFVYVSACWALLSSSPLACMNVLKSASHSSDNQIVYTVVPILANVMVNIIHLSMYTVILAK